MRFSFFSSSKWNSSTKTLPPVFNPSFFFHELQQRTDEGPWRETQVDVCVFLSIFLFSQKESSCLTRRGLLFLSRVFIPPIREGLLSPLITSHFDRRQEGRENNKNTSSLSRRVIFKNLHKNWHDLIINFILDERKNACSKRTTCSTE